jgi:hypothetical protein
LFQESIKAGRLWSLLDMLKFNASNFHHISSALSWMMAVARRGVADNDQFDADPEIRRQLQASLTGVAKNCRAVGLDFSAIQAERINRDSVAGDYGFSDMEAGITDLFSRISDELQLILCLHVPAELAKHYEADQPYGELVAMAFPSANSDIEEASKCLALSRPTATVFHEMRTLEVGLKRLAAALDIPYAPSWESYLTQINKNIEAKHASKSRKWKKRQAFLTEVAGDLQVIKIAWRNPTMHIVRIYTPDEAAQIFNAAKSLMVRLAESGISDKTKKSIV